MAAAAPAAVGAPVGAPGSAPDKQASEWSPGSREGCPGKSGLFTDVSPRCPGRAGNGTRREPRQPRQVISEFEVSLSLSLCPEPTLESPAQLGCGRCSFSLY